MPNAPVDPITIFNIAESFYHGSQLIAHRFPKALILGPSHAVTAALALELYFKCLIALETGENPPRGHNLEKLFNKISKDGQTNIRQRFDNPQLPSEIDQRNQIKNLPNVPDDIDRTFNFDGILRRSARAFERFRYVYETSVPGDELTSWEAGYVIYCTRLHIIQDHRPEWGR